VLRFKDAGTYQVANRLRSILVAARLRKLVIDGDGNPLHWGLNTELSIAYAFSH
jgi:hypothetical protein